MTALRGIALTLSGVILFAGTNSAAKWVMFDIPTGEMLFVRGVVALSVISLFITRAQLSALWSGGQLRLHALRNACSAVEVGCFYWAITKNPLADVTAIYLASPIYVTALAAMFLGERVGWRRWLAVGVGFAGVLVAVRPSSAVISGAAVIAVGGSVLYAISLVVTRRLRTTPSTLLVATQMAALIVLSGSVLSSGWVTPSPMQLGMMAAIGVVSMVAFWCVNQGLRLAAASVVAPFNYTSIVWASAMGWLVFGEMPAPATLVGAGIIVGAGLFLVLGAQPSSETFQKVAKPSSTPRTVLR